MFHYAECRYAECRGAHSQVMKKMMHSEYEPRSPNKQFLSCLKREDTLVKACTGKVIGKGYRCFSLGSNRKIEFIRKMRTIGLVS